MKQGKFEIPGLNVEKLHGKASKTYSARMSRELRLIFSIRKDANESSLVIHEINHHDDAYNRVDRTSGRVLSSLSQTDPALEIDQKSITDFESPIIDSPIIESEDEGSNAQHRRSSAHLFRVPHYLLVDPGKYLQFERSLDRYLMLSEEQEEILEIKNHSILVQGPAGTGKTTLALFHALNLFENNPNDAIYLFTYHEELACVCRAYKVNLLGDDDCTDAEQATGIQVFSYIDFCKRHIRRVVEKKEHALSWINKQQSIEILQQIIEQKSRWERAFKASDLYGLIYSTLKGRFMPGTEMLPSSKEDYERIFRDYGRTPQALDEILEIFSLYQSRLKNNKSFDEADLIRMSYESLKDKALLTQSDRRLWIVIDEVQDFTELEWKSILLFWENQSKQDENVLSYPFLSGDTNQNISRSGFRWQELESYLQQILRKLKRGNALRRIVLHQNYRNTKQIHDLAAFIRKFGSDTSDLGLAPENQGSVPLLAISDDAQMLKILRQADQTNDLLNPVVVLIEDDDSLSYLRKELADCQNIFLLSLRNSKGMEFEDVIIYRAFSSSSKIDDQSSAEASRLFDLWYMGITRARNCLALICRTEDQESLKLLLGERFQQFIEGVEYRSNTEEAISEFLDKREIITPNYNVIFLERKFADDLWDIYSKAAQSTSDISTLDQFTIASRDRALNLWRRCLDYASLGRAYVQLENYELAIQFLLRAGLLEEAAPCLVLSERYIEAAQIYEKLGLSLDAARAYEYGQSFLKAAELYEKNEEWALAAENYYSGGDLSKSATACEKSGMHRSAAEIYRIKGKYLKAAELYNKAEDYINAGEMFLRIKDKLDAARAFQKAGRFEKAIELYESLNRWSEAGDVCKQAALFARAAELYLKAGRLLDSAQSYEESLQLDRAAELYLKARDHSAAAKTYEKSGRLSEASALYEQAGNFKKAAELAADSENLLVEARCREKLSEFQKASDLYKLAGSLNESAYCLEKLNEFAKAAELYLKSENYPQAAACLAKVDRKLDAAKLYVIAGQFPAAYELASSSSLNSSSGKSASSDFLNELIDWCEETKRPAAQASLFELSKNFSAAAEKFRDSLMLGKAASCYERAGKTLEAAELYFQTGDYEKAAESYKTLKRWKDAAISLERIQKWNEAKQLYERIRDIEGINRCTSAMNWL